MRPAFWLKVLLFFTRAIPASVSFWHRSPNVAKRERWILKRLHGCVRKAKQFESGKLMRRVKNAIKQQGGHTGSFLNIHCLVEHQPV